MDGPPPPEEDFSTIPVEDRLAHKNWKARVSAYEQLIKSFQNSTSEFDPVFRPYLHNSDLLKKIAADANAVAQEKGVETLVALVKFAGENAAKTRPDVMPTLVDKCFGSTRAGTKKHATELALQYVEVENEGSGVISDILPGLGAKQPKAVAGCVAALKEIVRLFGTQVAPPQSMLKVLPKIFAHTDKAVRAEGILLTCALYRYIGSALDPFLNDLKPVQVKELHETFEKLEADGQGKGTLKPERVTCAKAREGVNLEEEEQASEEQEAALPDPRSFAEVVDVTSKLPSGWQTNLVSSKWKERKESLDEMASLFTGSPRIKDVPEIGDVVKALAGRMTDANINCVVVAAVCIEALAKGMMEPFAKYRETTVPPMLERLKERKANVTDAIGLALDAIFTTTALSDLLAEIIPSLSSKNPQVKEGTLKFLFRCLSATSIAPTPPQAKQISEQLAILLEDSFEGARNEAATCLGTLMKIVGERPLNALMDTIADVRKAKVKEAFEKATVKCKAGAGGPPKPPSAPAKAPTKASSPKKPASKTPASEEQPSTEPSAPPPKAAPKGPPPRLQQKATPPKKPVAPPASGKATKAAPAPAPGSLDTFKYKHTPEDAEGLAVDQIPSNFHTDLADANWKTRLAALEEMITWVQDNVTTIDSEIVVRFLGKKGWAEKNFQVSAKLYGILTLLATECPSFGRSSAALSIPHLSEKLGDAKLKKPAGETLLAFGEKTSLSFVLNQAYEPLSKQKAPKVVADALSWIDSAIQEFGVAGLSLRALIEFLKLGLANSNAGVRTSATKTLVTVKLFAGAGIKDLLGDLNPQLLSTISSEFDKVEGQSPPEPTRTSADLASAAPAESGSGGKGSAPTLNPMDDLFPRVELDALLKGTSILADAKNDAWKTKKEALESLQAILDQGANKRLKPTMGEIAQVLKARVTDTNQAVKLLALDIVGRIATGMEKGFDKHTKLLVPSIATVLSDQKAPIRSAATVALSAIATACEGLDSMVPSLTTALEATNPLQRGSLLQWLAEWFGSHEFDASLDVKPWAAPIVSCLDDRATDVRKAANAVLPFIIGSTGVDFVLQQTKSLKPASQATATTSIRTAAKSAPEPAVKTPAITAKTATPAVAPPIEERAQTPSPPPSAPNAAGSKMAPPGKFGVRRKLPGPGPSSSRPESVAEVSDGPAPTVSRFPNKASFGLRKPGITSTATSATQSSAASPVPSAHSLVFITGSQEQKKSRGAKDASKWVNEAGSTRKELVDLLQHQMEPHTSKDVMGLLFSTGHNHINDHIDALDKICDFYSQATTDEVDGLSPEESQAIGLANVDLPLKFVSMTIHEPQSNLVSKCLDVVENLLAFLRHCNYQLSEPEALCFIPTIIYKLGDAREAVRVRVQHLIQTLPTVYAYSRVFQLLLEHGLTSKVAKTRQGALDELGGILKRSGVTACNPSKAFPAIASMISDKDPNVRKSALSTLSEAFVLVGEKVWQLVGALSPKDKTQLEERLRRVPGPSTADKASSAPAAPNGSASRFMSQMARPASPSTRLGGIPRAASPSVAGASRFGGSSATSNTDARPAALGSQARAASPARASRLMGPGASGLPGPSGLPAPGARSKLPSRLAPPRTLQSVSKPAVTSQPNDNFEDQAPAGNGDRDVRAEFEEYREASSPADDDISIIISTILSSDSTRSVEALKKIQKILEVPPGHDPPSVAYQNLSEHTDGLIETITLQLGHVFDRPDDVASPENFRLAKHLIQTLNAFCDHSLLAESLPVDILQSLLEELTQRLLQTDETPDSKVKDLSRFINMIILRFFATARRMAVFRALFNLLLHIVKPFPAAGTTPDSKEARVAELVLKCLWKLARSIPSDLEKQLLDPVELFPAIEYFLQSVPPNEWRARATNKVPCGDMPLRTIKVIIQHVVAHYGDDVYDLLSASFEDPSATIVYPYVYRILNSAPRTAEAAPRPGSGLPDHATRYSSPSESRPMSPQATSSTFSGDRRNSSPSHRTSSHSANGNGHYEPAVEEPDPDAQLLTIINHISSDSSGAMHKEGITELYQFIKAYPHKKSRVDKMLDSTGPAFRKYIARALATRAAEDEEREAVVADTLHKLESKRLDDAPVSPRSPVTSDTAFSGAQEEKLYRLHNLFQYKRTSTLSNESSQHDGRQSPPARI